jgi:D-aminoacyl-tRNA deacylase
VRALVQRVNSASVRVDEKVIGEIGRGLCCFVGVTHGDGETASRRLAERLWSLRIFEDDNGRINRSAEELGLEVLVISQFTLYADTSRGRRPSFIDAAPPEHAEPLVAELVAALEQLGARVATGRFGAMMAVELVNDGPFTVMLEC